MYSKFTFYLFPMKNVIKLIDKATLYNKSNLFSCNNL